MRLVFQERLAIITVESIVARLESRQIRACRATAYLLPTRTRWACLGHVLKAVRVDVDEYNINGCYDVYTVAKELKQRSRVLWS